MEITNHVRGYRFLLGVLRSQQADPFCGRCSALANSLQAAREGLARFAADEAAGIAALSPELQAMLAAARDGLNALPSPHQPAGQKKAGNCRLPQGICFVKASLAILRQV